jgi:hypothetical protein
MLLFVVAIGILFREVRLASRNAEIQAKHFQQKNANLKIELDKAIKDVSKKVGQINAQRAELASNDQHISWLEKEDGPSWKRKYEIANAEKRIALISGLASALLSAFAILRRRTYHSPKYFSYKIIETANFPRPNGNENHFQNKY